MHFSLPKSCTFVSPFLIGAEFRPSVAKNILLFGTLRILRKIRTVKWRDKGSTWSSKTNDRISGCTVLLLIEKMNQINTKNYWKEIVREVTLGGIDTTWENLHKAQIRKAFFPLTGLIFAFRSADFLRWCLFPERNLTHNLFFYFQ